LGAEESFIKIPQHPLVEIALRRKLVPATLPSISKKAFWLCKNQINEVSASTTFIKRDDVATSFCINSIDHQRKGQKKALYLTAGEEALAVASSTLKYSTLSSH
jgi:hypothetical protein